MDVVVFYNVFGLFVGIVAVVLGLLSFIVADNPLTGLLSVLLAFVGAGFVIGCSVFLVSLLWYKYLNFVWVLP